MIGKRRANSLIVGAALLAAPAFAQDPAPEGEPEAAGEEEVVVTATKRETRLQTTPASITALGAKTIEDTQLQTVEDLQTQSPGLVWASTSGQPQIALRGIGIEISGFTADAGVALNVDGVYLSRITAAGGAFDDLERIEVLRGPQGTLYGRNATGGAINIITKTPGVEAGGEGSLLYGSFDRLKATAAIEGALNTEGDLLGRLSIFADTRGSQMFNSFTGRDFDDYEAYSVRGVLVTKLSEDVEITWRADYFKESDSIAFAALQELSVIDPASGNFGITPSTPGGIFQGSLNLTPTFPLINNGRDVPNNIDNNYVTREALGVSATLEWDISEALTLRSISAYRETEFGRAGDTDGSSAQILSEAFNKEESWQFSQEFNLLGTFGNGSDFILGAYYFNDDGTNIDIFNFTALARVIERATELGGGLPIGSLSGAIPDELVFDDAQTTTSTAAFGQINYALTDRLKLTGGLRYTRDEKDFTQTLRAFGAAQCEDASFNESWDGTTWRVGLDYEVTDETFAYASASKGFKAGGFNLGACNNSFDPEEVVAYEVGVKNRFFDGALVFNVTGFYYDYSDLQTNIYTIGGGTVQNAANARIWGSEIEIQAEPIDGLLLIGNLSLLHTEFDEFFAADPYNPTAGLQDLTGNRLQRAPEWTANGVVSYTWSVGNGDANVRYEIYHSDGYYNNVHNTLDTLQEPFTVQNIRVSYSQDSWEVGAFGENIGDEIYTMMRLPIGGIGAVVGVYAPRATWGAYTRFRF